MEEQLFDQADVYLQDEPQFSQDDVYAQQVGRVRVGRCDYRRGCRFEGVDGFTPILAISKDPTYSGLSPFFLRDENGVLVENRWQFSAIYKSVPKTKQKNWQHPAEDHMDAKGEPTPAYWAWRRKGFAHDSGVRFPVGRQVRKQCQGAIVDEKSTRKLPYVESRRAIYVPVYTAAVKRSPIFRALKQRLLAGENLLIVDIDGPHTAAMKYYKKKYGVGDDFIDEDGTMEATLENFQILLGDERHPFGHGFCLAAALLDIEL